MQVLAEQVLLEEDKSYFNQSTENNELVDRRAANYSLHIMINSLYSINSDKDYSHNEEFI